jgi:hypothetical protein
MLLTHLFGLALSLLPAIVEASAFIGSCEPTETIVDEPYLIAICEDEGGAEIYSVLNLNTCIANDNGVMAVSLHNIIAPLLFLHTSILGYLPFGRDILLIQE